MSLRKVPATPKGLKIQIQPAVRIRGKCSETVHDVR